MIKEPIKRLIGTLDKLSSIDPDKLLKVSFDIIYLGPVSSDLFHVEIRNSDGTLGWLYSSAQFVVYKNTNILYVIKLSELKDIVESKLASKVFIHPTEPIRADVLIRREDNSVEGWVDTYTVSANSEQL